MNDDERQQRLRTAISEDIAGGRAGWWYLSFSKRKFAGACIVRAYGLADAMAMSHKLGINPGGDVLGGELDHEPPEWATNKLLSKEDLERAFGALETVRR